MKLLHFIREISDNEEEFLAIIKEMNSWVQNNEEENKQRFVRLPHNFSRFNFSRDEYRKALDIATNAIQNTETHRENRQINSLHRENKSISTPSLFF